MVTVYTLLPDKLSAENHSFEQISQSLHHKDKFYHAAGKEFKVGGDVRIVK